MKKIVEEWCSKMGYVLIDVKLLDKTNISFEDAQRVAETICMINYGSVSTKSRESRVVFARWLLWEYLKRTTDLSLSRIGHIYGNKNHATVSHGIYTVSKKRLHGWKRNMNERFRAKMNNIHDKLQIERAY